jgi:hypothetical protein
MEPDEVRALRESAQTLDAQLRVVNDDGVVCCIGLLATLYFHHGDRPEVRERVAAALDRYVETTGHALVWGADPFTGTPTRIAGTNLLDVREWSPRVGTKERMQIMLHGGQRSEDADPYSVLSFVGARRPTQLSFFSFTLPFRWLTDNPGGAFTQLVLEQCYRLQPTHGYAGLAVIPHVDASPNSESMASVLPFVARFSGLEIDLPWSHAMYLEQEDRIKGVNWLTILDNPWIERLGGTDALRSSLGNSIEWHPFDSGVVLQAGPRPVFGDVNRREPMPYYRQVAKALKPIRVTSVRAISAPYGFDRERSDEWLRRFDD